MTALLNLVKAAVFAALIAVMTAYIKFNTGINDGYLHFGDSMIYLAACILPLPYAMAAAAIGGFLCRYTSRCCRLGSVYGSN